MQPELPLKRKIPMSWIIATISSLLLGGMVYANAIPKQEYQPQTPQAQQAYETWSKQGCEKEKVVAQANLADIGHGVKLEGKDLNELYRKANQDCTF
jgi:hypothetical protein